MEQRFDSADRDHLSEEYDVCGELRGASPERYAKGADIEAVDLLKLVAQSERSIKADRVRPHSEVMSELRSRPKTK